MSGDPVGVQWSSKMQDVNCALKWFCSLPNHFIYQFKENNDFDKLFWPDHRFWTLLQSVYPFCLLQEGLSLACCMTSIRLVCQWSSTISKIDQNWPSLMWELRIVSAADNWRCAETYLRSLRSFAIRKHLSFGSQNCWGNKNINFLGWFVLELRPTRGASSKKLSVSLLIVNQCKPKRIVLLWISSISRRMRSRYHFRNFLRGGMSVVALSTDRLSTAVPKQRHLCPQQRLEQGSWDSWQWVKKWQWLFD